MIENLEDGSTVYSQDIMLSWELYLGLFMLITIVLILPAIWLLSRAYHPKQVCIVRRDHIAWDEDRVKLFFKDIVCCYKAKKFFWLAGRNRNIKTILTFQLKNGTTDLDNFYKLSTREQQHLLKLLRKLGVKQKRGKLFAQQPQSLAAWQAAQEQQFLEESSED